MTFVVPEIKLLKKKINKFDTIKTENICNT